jgi:hypothetical protein
MGKSLLNKGLNVFLLVSKPMESVLYCIKKFASNPSFPLTKKFET